MHLDRRNAECMKEICGLVCIEAVVSSDMKTDKTYEITGFFSFRAEMNKNIKRTITALRRQGTVAMSPRNLLSVTPTPKIGGPLGTNAPYIYEQMFNEEIDKLSRPYKAFVSL